MNKKGLAGYIWFAITYTFRMLIILTIFSVVYSNVFRASSSTVNMEHTLHSSRLLYSKHSVFYEDPLTERIYLSRVGSDTFKQERLEKLFPEEPEFAAVLALQQGDPLAIDLVFYGTARGVYKNPAARLGGTEITFPVIKDGSPTFLTAGVMFAR